MAVTEQRDWWAHPAAIAGLLVAAILPLLWPALPPLVDLPGHMGRYRVSLGIDESAYLARYFEYHWAIVGNLGVDLLVVPLSRLIGLEPAVKLIVMAIPPLTMGGMLLTAREIHGRIPPTALFALPLAYAYPFQFGFVNFALAIALMFVGIGLWLRLGRLGRVRLRIGLFVPLSFALFLAHSVAWGMFGLAIFAIELVSAWQRDPRLSAVFARAILACLPLAPPLLLMADWWLHRSAGEASQFWIWGAKIYHALTVLRNSSERFDSLSAVLLYALLLLAGRRIGLRFEARLGVAALMLFVAYLLMPGIVMSAAYADMRMAAYTLAVAVLAIAPDFENAKWRQIIGVAGLVFLVARLGVQGWTYWKLDRGYQAQLAAIDHIPPGARVFAMANLPCSSAWDQDRFDHLGTMAIVRRDAFVNGQWPMPGGKLLSVRYPAADGWALAPTQLLTEKPCRQPENYSLGQVISGLPRGAFDFLWLIGVDPAKGVHDPGFIPVWQGQSGVLYRIAH